MSVKAINRKSLDQRLVRKVDHKTKAEKKGGVFQQVPPGGKDPFIEVVDAHENHDKRIKNPEIGAVDRDRPENEVFSDPYQKIGEQQQLVGETSFK